MPIGAADVSACALSYSCSMPATSGSPTQIATSQPTKAALSNTPADQFQSGDLGYVQEELTAGNCPLYGLVSTGGLPVDGTTVLSVYQNTSARWTQLSRLTSPTSILVMPTGTDADASRIQAAGAAMGLVGGRVILGAGAYSVTSDVTTASNVTVEFLPGAIFDIASTKTLNITGPVVGADGVAVTGAGTARWHGRRLTYLWLVGDSLGVGSGTPYVGGWRTGAEAALRWRRSDFDFVGHVMTLASTSAATGLAWHSCVSGSTIAAATAALASRLAECTATPDAVVVQLGTNDMVVGQSAAQMQSAWTAYESAVFAALPNAVIIVVAPPPFVAGTSVGGNLAAWNAVRTAYVAWLKPRCLADRRMRYVDPAADPGLSAGEYQDDGVHYNRLGNAVVGGAIADTIDAFMGTIQDTPAPPLRAFRQRQFAGSVLVDAAGDVRTVTGAGLDIPAVGHYAVAVDLYPTALAAGPLAVLAIGPRNANPAMWLCIRQLGNALDLGGYSGTGTWVTTANPGAEDRCLVLNKWHRLVAIIHRGNGVVNTGSAALYVNGRLVGQIYGLPGTWPASAFTTYLGNSPDYVSCPGYYSSLRVWSGANVPRPGSMAALAAVEANYFLDEPVAPGCCTSVREFDGNLLDTVSGNAASTLVGGATALAPAYPGGTPLRPWEIGSDYP